MYYFEVLKNLYECDLRYLIVGGLAVNLHHVPRMTYDVDIILSMGTPDIINFINITRKLNYIPRLPVDPKLLCDPETVKTWRSEKNMKAFSFYHVREQYKIIDLVIDHPLNFDESFKNRLVRKVENIAINVISLPDLILMKKHSARERDLNGVVLLEQASALLDNRHER